MIKGLKPAIWWTLFVITAICFFTDVDAVDKYLLTLVLVIVPAGAYLLVANTKVNGINLKD